MKTRISFAALWCLVLARTGLAGTLLFCPFDSLDGWEVHTIGVGRVRVVDLPGRGLCLEAQATRATAMLSRELPAQSLAGRKVTVRCSAKVEQVVRGAQAHSTAKVHLAVRTAGGVRHFAARLVGSADWAQAGFTADVPADARRVRLNLGLEACSGRALFDTLVVTDDRRRVRTLDLAAAANATLAELGLGAVAGKALVHKAAPFSLVAPANQGAADCIRLCAADGPARPAQLSTPIVVNSCVSSVYILHGAWQGKPMRETPCAIWTATFAGGRQLSFSVFEGREIGAIGRATDCENWKVAWTGQTASGRPATFGVTRWRFYSRAPVVSLTCRSYRGAAPVVLAATVVEDAPTAAPQADGQGEGGDEDEYDYD